MTKHGLSDADYRAVAVERFLRRVDRSGGPEACWPWTGATQSGGYGTFGTKRPGERTRHHLVHRFALEHLGAGPFDASRPVKHTCSTKVCVNPAHLVQPDPRPREEAR